jgi:hypothetical protein
MLSYSGIFCCGTTELTGSRLAVNIKTTRIILFFCLIAAQRYANNREVVQQAGYFCADGQFSVFRK